LNDWLARTQRVLELRYDADEYRWAWRTDQLSTDLVRPMYPVVLAAMELLLSPKRRDVRRCEGPPGCGWLFLDHTKNHSRRWCSMRDCGNRAKMRRFQEKKKNNRGNEG
jgi:predicted RNA-binding Zn ribbon-like protein